LFAIANIHFCSSPLKFRSSLLRNWQIPEFNRHRLLHWFLGKKVRRLLTNLQLNDRLLLNGRFPHRLCEIPPSRASAFLLLSSSASLRLCVISLFFLSYSTPLCQSKKQTVVELTLPKDANIHAKEYQRYLPSKELLQAKLLEWTRAEEASQ